MNLHVHQKQFCDFDNSMMNDIPSKEHDGYYKNKSSSTSSKDTDSSVFQNSMLNINQDDYVTLSYPSVKGKVLKTTNTIQCGSNTFDVNSHKFKQHLRSCKECKMKQMEMNIQHQTMINTINERQQHVRNEVQDLNETIDTFHVHGNETSQNENVLNSSMITGNNEVFKFNRGYKNVNENKREIMHTHNKRKAKANKHKHKIINEVEEDEGNQNDNDDDNDMLDEYFVGSKCKQKKKKEESDEDDDTNNDELNEYFA
jgi:hypothetical protein